MTNTLEQIVAKWRAVTESDPIAVWPWDACADELQAYIDAQPERCSEAAITCEHFDQQVVDIVGDNCKKHGGTFASKEGHD